MSSLRWPRWQTSYSLYSLRKYNLAPYEPCLMRFILFVSPPPRQLRHVSRRDENKYKNTKKKTIFKIWVRQFRVIYRRLTSIGSDWRQGNTTVPHLREAVSFSAWYIGIKRDSKSYDPIGNRALLVWSNPLDKIDPKKSASSICSVQTGSFV
jgi:hypothetical protein